MTQRVDTLLQHPLYVFELPEDVLATLTPQKQEDQSHEQLYTVETSQQRELTATRHDGPASSATSCALCGLNFVGLQEQRSHVRSDLHGFNLKRRIKGLETVREAEFERLVDELDESLSGSASSDTDSDLDEKKSDQLKSKSSTLDALMKQQGDVAAPRDDELALANPSNVPRRLPLIWFASSALPAGISLGIYKAMFTNAELSGEKDIVDVIRRKQIAREHRENRDIREIQPRQVRCGPSDVAVPSNAARNAHMFMCMIGGGHFAGMVISLAQTVHTKHAGERQATVLVHKTFHRYTTRRKQGGSQSANDSAKGSAHSAGSSLRRYNETALVNEVRALLTSWSDLIESAQLLFVRATGSTNRRALFGPYEGQVLHQGDPRLRGFPFTTRRATHAELMRSFVELTRAKITRTDNVVSAAVGDAKSAENTPRHSAAEHVTTRVKEGEEREGLLLHHGSQLHSLIRRSKAPAVLSYMSSNNLTPDFTFHPAIAQQHHAPTLLHFAAAVNSPPVVLALLTKGRADPTTRNAEGRTSFEIAGDRATRDAFRVARSELGEDAWDWDAARVTGPLTKEECDFRAEKERRDELARESRRRKEDLERLEKDPSEGDMGQSQIAAGKARVIATAAGHSGKGLEEEARGMTQDMRTRLERERRARAAEDRIKRTQKGQTSH